MAKLAISQGESLCNVAGCGGHATRLQATICEKHYMRRRRNGHDGLTQRPDLVQHSHGYLLRYAPNHPLATDGQRSRVYEHRAVYYAAHGDGPFACRWCGGEVTWATLHIDHLDDDKTNNTLTNLAASCPVCNQQRGHHKMVRKIRDGRSRVIEWRGRSQTICDWADDLHVPVSRLKARLNAGWSVERAMTEPRGVSGPAPRGRAFLQVVSVLGRTGY